MMKEIETLFTAGDFANVVPLLLKVISNAPAPKGALAMCTIAHFALGQRDKALDFAEQLLDQGVQTALDSKALAIAAMERKDWAEAADFAVMCLEANPADQRNKVLLAQALIELNSTINGPDGPVFAADILLEVRARDRAAFGAFGQFLLGRALLQKVPAPTDATENAVREVVADHRFSAFEKYQVIENYLVQLPMIQPIFNDIRDAAERSSGPIRLSHMALTVLDDSKVLIDCLSHVIVEHHFWEMLVTSVRYSIAQLISKDTAALGHWPKLWQAVSFQCYLAEYCFQVSPAEIDLVQATLAAVIPLIGASDRLPPDSQLILLAAYQDLGTLADGGLLRMKVGAKQVSPIIDLHIGDARRRRKHAGEIKSINKGSPVSSSTVRAFYEANPYPRYGALAPPSPQISYADYLLDQYGLTDLSPKFHHAVEVLLAGCGTGRALMSSALYRTKKVDCLDLSLPSLCYARQRAQDAGYSNVGFFQGDLLDLPQWGRSYDLIECAGVIHHLPDPALGLHGLKSALKPDGIVNLAVYATVGRTSIEAVKSRFDLNDAAQSLDRLRRLRAEIHAAAEQDEDARWVTRFTDFYSVSGTRALLLHPLDNTYSAEGLWQLVDQAGFEIIVASVINVPDRLLLAPYMTNDPYGRSLATWQAIEQHVPQALRSMFDLYLRAKA
jgi:SAM-dependent methyltransferase/tetratricopeptide (TPR) repeat protein